MVKGEAVMAVAIKPLRRRRRTAQRGKPMTQSQRWGKVVTTMPVPEGNITTSDILVPVVEEVVEVVEAVEEETKDED
jgi:hypothetical protein